MKRFGNIFPKIIEFENLLEASKKAQKGKRFRDSVLEFNENLEGNLLKLQNKLKTQTYKPGDYHTFRIYDPKPRLISAAPYRDRVVHHALCNVIVPLIEKSFIPDSYANRKGYGTHRALTRFIGFARSSRYVLQCDIKKYFPSIDHQILKEQIRHYLKCPETLWLIDTIIDNSNEQEPVHEIYPGDTLLTLLERKKGLPIGNLSSQILCNVFLNKFDHFVKEDLKCKKYLRYVDDFALFSDDWDYLAAARQEIEAYLTTLRLTVHPIKSQLFETKHGANFLGFRVLPNQVRVRNDNLRRSRQRLIDLQYDYRYGQISLEKLVQRLQSWEAHLKHGDTYRLRQDIFEHWTFQRQDWPFPKKI
ncbi:reverse transcriptase/maturase family protein [Crocosphaera sp. XPORK-15E]|uniref:reverse transcriptase/maturase family protein n=1 Tax=Crocosphaera sp. XPORK-15E TaxID=3110247 RepID=UPI002B2064B2|nr:reverse transcriptase/maturase family protein [Crocosphaera sp. XPORK-15E]MEA5537033.1 reverse transcriptase/maturase family protein [Crocosphaera sp. XPORK-15E]